MKSDAPSKSNASYHQFLDYIGSLNRSTAASQPQVPERAIQGENYPESIDYGISSTGNPQRASNLKLGLCACSMCRYQGEVDSYPQYSGDNTNAGGSFQNYSDPGTFLGIIPTTYPEIDFNKWNTLNSRPGAQYAIYLDFDGYYSTNSIWEAKGRRGGELSLSSFFQGWDGTNTSNDIFNAISLIHRRVSEDFNFLDVNVTTDWNQVKDLDTDFWVGAVFTDNYNLATGRSIKNAGGGGTAYLGSFDNVSGYDEPVLIFNGYNDTSFPGVYAAGETASHEVGHSLDLQHDGTSTSSYWGGDEGTDETSFAAIMGASFIDFDENVTRWSDGNYADASQTQDDIAIMANFLALAADEEGDNFANAQVIENDSRYKGSIGVNKNEESNEYLWDYDYFLINWQTITTNGLSISAVNASTVYYGDSSINPLSLDEFDQTVYGPNLDLWGELHLATKNQDDSFQQLSSYILNDSTLSLNFDIDLRGLYFEELDWLTYLNNPDVYLFLSLHGGNGPQGTTTSQDSQDLNYGSEYGSLGEYQLTISEYDVPNPEIGKPILSYSLDKSNISEDGSAILSISIDPNEATSLGDFWLDFQGDAIYAEDYTYSVDPLISTYVDVEQNRLYFVGSSIDTSISSLIQVTVEALNDEDDVNETIEISLGSDLGPEDMAYDLPADSLLLTIIDNDIVQKPNADIINGQNKLWDELTGQQYFLDDAPFGVNDYASSSSPAAFDPRVGSTDTVQVKTQDESGQWYGVSKYSLNGVNGMALFYDPVGDTNITTGKGPDEDDDLVAFISGWTVKGKTFLYEHDDPDYATWIDVVGWSTQV